MLVPSRCRARTVIFMKVHALFLLIKCWYLQTHFLSSLPLWVFIRTGFLGRQPSLYKRRVQWRPLKRILYCLACVGVVVVGVIPKPASPKEVEPLVQLYEAVKASNGSGKALPPVLGFQPRPPPSEGKCLNDYNAHTHACEAWTYIWTIWMPWTFCHRA